MATNKNLNKLNKKLIEIVAKTKGSDIIWNPSFFADTYYNEQEKVTKSAFNENTTKTLNEFIQLRDDILSLLKSLKKESEKDYLIGFSETYNIIIKLVYNDNFSNPEDYFGFTSDGKGGMIYYILTIRHEIYKQVFKKIVDTLIIKYIDDFDSAFKLPTSYNDTIEYINEGFYELESMMEGKILQMKYFNIPRAIEKFNSLRNKYINKPKESLLLLDKYFNISQQIYNQIDQGEFENAEAFEDQIFIKTWNELSFFYDNMQSLFTKAEVDYLNPTGATKVLDILNPLNTPQAKPVQIIETIKEKLTPLTVMENIYLVDWLEIESSKEAVNYFKSDEFNLSIDDGFNPYYLEEFMSSDMLSKFLEYIYKYVAENNDIDIHKFFNISLNQFKNNKPNDREPETLRIFYKYLKNTNERFVYANLTDEDLSNFNLFANAYLKSFNAFKEATENTFNDFKSGVLKSSETLIKQEKTTLSSSKNNQTVLNKIPTSLSVPELAYLFRALVDESIINPRQNTDLYKAITTIFESKQTDDISVNSFKNKFDTPDFNAIDSWQEKFAHLMQSAKKSKDIDAASNKKK